MILKHANRIGIGVFTSQPVFVCIYICTKHTKPLKEIECMHLLCKVIINCLVTQGDESESSGLVFEDTRNAPFAVSRII